MNAEVAKLFTPTGRLRASINLGNPILASRANDGAPRGVSVDLAREFAQRLGVELETVVFDTARESVEAVTNEMADIGFFAIAPKRGEGILFTGPYVLIQGAYMVRNASPLRHSSEVDRAGRRVVVGAGSAYDLFLSREIRHATLLRAPTSPTVVDEFVATGADVAAGVRQQLESDAKRLGGLRVFEDSFMEIRQAMGVPRSRGAAAQQVLATFVDDMIQSSFVAEALKRHKIEGALVAPVSAV